MMKHPTKPCPTPEKQCYRTVEQARIAAWKVVRELNKAGEVFTPKYAYRCNCGWLHMTHHATWYGKPLELVLRVPEDLQLWAMRRTVDDD